jgi:hypothetical protein
LLRAEPVVLRHADDLGEEPAPAEQGEGVARLPGLLDGLAVELLHGRVPAYLAVHEVDGFIDRAADVVGEELFLHGLVTPPRMELRSSVAKPKARPSPLERAVRELLVRKAKARFKKLFGTEFDPDWGASVFAHFKKLQAQDDAVRKLAPNIRRTPNRVRAFIRSQGLENDPFQPGNAPSLVSMAAAAQEGDIALKTWFIKKDPIAHERRYASFRIAVVEFFESLPANVIGKSGSAEDLERWNAEGFNDRRVLTDGELVTIMICIAPGSVTLFQAELDGPPEQTELKVRRRELEQMRDVRRRWGTERRPSTPAQRAAEKNKKPLLPWPQGEPAT